MPKINLTELRSLPDPLTSEHYEFQFQSLPAGGNESDLRIQCQSISIPSKLNDVQLVSLYGTELPYAGRANYAHEVTITFVEDRELKIWSALDEWLEYVRIFDNQTGHYKQEYITTATVGIYDAYDTPVRTIKFEGIFPTNLPEVPFDGTASNVITLAVTFNYDRYIWDEGITGGGV